MFKKLGNLNKTEPQEAVLKRESTEEEKKDLGSSLGNTILKGSKLIGNITVSCDLELSGEIQGNITSEKNANIIIKGICKGNIETREGNVNIEGELDGGNIIAGNNVTIAGKFKGGEIRARGKISINGEFSGKLEADEIEIGPDTKGNGEILYREYISIARGAKIEAHISQVSKELKLIKPCEEKPKEQPQVKEAKET